MGQAIEWSGIPVQDYLEGEKFAVVRHEYINGQVFAMVGTSRAHNVIAGNLYALLRAHLKGGPCQVYMSDVKVHVQSERDERFYYPDLFVECETGDVDHYFSEAPKLVVEVLSISTERVDRAEKMDAYRCLDSLEEYLLVAQDRQWVELYRRTQAWRPRVFADGAEFQLHSMDLTVSLADLYDSAPLEGAMP